MGSHPDIQDRVMEEIDYILDGNRDRDPTMKELMDMKYLECVIKEALRLYPSVPLIARKIKEDVVLGINEFKKIEFKNIYNFAHFGIICI